ncbi:acid phosphatase type 7 isoform X2 [Nematostella vectensis]|nr:acid phosphatase type 7 isoform X2 [Nematostella vectensis]
MMVTWATMARTNNSFVEFGLRGQPLGSKVDAEVSKFRTCGVKKRTIWIHRAKLEGLVPSEGYDYRCGGDHGWSAIYTFNASNAGSDWSPSFAVYGDLGVGNPMALAKLQREVQSGHYDAILHIGDFAYDMASDMARVGDTFMNQIETMAAYTPYMVCPGNHEHACNFSDYRKRFSMPGGTEGIFYSWNIGPAHIISFSTEVYYFLQFGIEQLVQQYKWLQKDLEEANLPHNRAQRPWIITMGHRPMYCSNIVGDGCQNHENAIRTGITSLKLFPLEELFYKHGVDLQLYGHEHSYERLYPVYQHKIYKGSEEEPYTNPKAPVHLTSGSAGCKYCHDSFKRDYGPWTAFRSLDYGFTRMKIHNNTHLYFEQVSIDKDYEVIDKVWLIKDTHGPASFQDAPQTSSQQPSDKKMRVNKIRNSGSEISQAVTDMIKNYYSKLKGVKDPYL